jgi:hypothetical protein
MTDNPLGVRSNQSLDAGTPIRIIEGSKLDLFIRAQRWPDMAAILEAKGPRIDPTLKEAYEAVVFVHSGLPAIKLQGATGRLFEPDTGANRGPAGAWWVVLARRVNGKPAYVSLYPRQWRAG